MRPQKETSLHSLTRIICFGDSISASEEVGHGQRWTDILEAILKERSVVNLGRGGATTSSAFVDFERELLPLLPALVLVQFGFNDSSVRDWTTSPRVSVDEYLRNMSIFAQAIRQRGGLPIFLRNHTPVRDMCIHGNGLSYNANFISYDCALVKLASKIEVPLLDIPLRLREAGLNSTSIVNADGLHLHVKGNELYARAVYAGLQPILNLS